MGSLNIAKCPNSSSKQSESMTAALYLCLLAFHQASLAPQYADQTHQELSGNQLDVFGDSQVEEVKNEAGYTAPDDYQEVSIGKLNSVATTEVDNVFENCVDYTASQGYECVPYYQCNNGTIITDGEGLIDIRNGFGILSPEDSKCPGFLDVCCKDPDFTPPPPPPVVKHVPKCGQRHQNGLGVRIQGFKEGESQFGEWPHMCAILSEEQVVDQDSGSVGGEDPQVVNLYQCGGSLIAPNVLLTAAHCVHKFQAEPSKLKVRCGEWDTQSQNEPRAHQDRAVHQVDLHPEFNGRNLANDWALLYTTEPFELQEHIDTICLPDPDEVFEGQDCFATGWGKDQFGAAGEYQVVLKEIDLPVVGHQECQDSLRRTRLGRKFQLDDSFICAGGVAGKDTCKGDGGGPLGDWLWGGHHSWGLCFCVKGSVLDRLCHELPPRKSFWGLLKLLGPLSPVPGVDGWRTEPVEPGGVGHAGCRVVDRKKEGEGLGHRGEGAEHVEPLQPVLDKLDLVQLWKGNGQSDLVV